ncbi:hypothetical protein HYH02_006626 [Chlamydomonas schloesseri]|uniref:Uncharacterized protein n=1 Tax=Chlamydomonas schloesseri TaxID=2026947 RepID=A0A835T5A4_9CHLO|nr:hypothetical protein HYH02_006626 [Chlamydomonas schloesseri]|eukprot:KAG2439104.1 hypothetical protein HYH02_006626 [Chlamydomonas schloesseri]
MEQMWKAAGNDFTWLSGLEEGALTYVRSWAQGNIMLSVVVQVEEGRRADVLKAAKGWRQESGVVVAPYLSRQSMQLRKQRTEVFRGLYEAGANPKWVGCADICFTNGQGERVMHQF